MKKTKTIKPGRKATGINKKRYNICLSDKAKTRLEELANQRPDKSASALLEEMILRLY